MKKILLSLLMFLAIGTTASAQVATSVEGTYTGDLYVSLNDTINDTTEPMTDQNVELTATANGSAIDFAIHNFSFGSIPVGDILLPAIGVSRSDNRVSFAENADVNLSFMGGAIQATANLDHVNSYIEGNTLVAYVNVAWTNGGETPIPIYVIFRGEKKDITDGISLPTATKRQADVIYTLDGRRVSATQQLPRGVYIINGKKVVK